LPGYVTTIGMFDSGLMLRAEVSTKIMRKDTVLDYLRECMKSENGLVSWFIFYVECFCYFIFIELLVYLLFNNRLLTPTRN